MELKSAQRPHDWFHRDSNSEDDWIIVVRNRETCRYARDLSFGSVACKDLVSQPVGVNPRQRLKTNEPSP